jgi:hypothetical protein
VHRYQLERRPQWIRILPSSSQPNSGFQRTALHPLRRPHSSFSLPVPLLERLRPPLTFRIEQRTATFGLLRRHGTMTPGACKSSTKALIVDGECLFDICWENHFADTQPGSFLESVAACGRSTVSSRAIPTNPSLKRLSGRVLPDHQLTKLK